MRRILDTLMAAARAEGSTARGRSPLAPTLEALAADWNDQFAGRGITLTVEASPAGLQVGADAEVLERVIAPLLDNAARYASSQVTLDARPVAGRIVVRVRDDGPGIEPGSADTIFEPGRRATSANGHGGAGLGLALARRLARAAGGDVTATADGPGATFLTNLPA
jgi:two-component system heavy metal sensor histidine kinase CusS